jgi:hypothetical protein
MTNLEVVTRSLRDADVPYAVIGAVALAARGISRATLDVDLLTTDRKVLDDEFWSAVRAAGLSVEVRRGDADDPLAGVIRIGGDEPIDLVVAKYIWQRDVVARAQSMEVRGLALPVPAARDLILLKLFAGGYGDLHDIARLLHIGPRELAADVSAALTDLPEEMRERWERLLRESP